ncbi:helix-turn-helix domain-containing protein [Priestia aryabhattai]|uniref:helix-turn-helix domain-containing protein n=1 Tax=Priestia aryabhattai TaxID=412384 RepID=UPI001ADB547E|nr:helix-turn-helix transcriptional regulator [Priestia aryabhattai]QTL52848.1 helix-turn-helix transcriptional regulator [Priestia aryabhattai]
MFGLGKRRTRLGKWIDKRNINQEWLVRKSGLGRSTVGDLVNNSERLPTQRTMKKILQALRRIDPNIKSEDFWDI